MVKLILVRHAHAAPPTASPDHARPLAEVGRDEAHAIGHWLAGHDVPSRALVSTARRTLETANIVASHWPGVELVALDALYQAGPAEAMALVRAHAKDSAMQTLALVGHNPTMAELVQALTDEIVTIRPGMAAVIELADWDAETGRLLAVGTP